MHLEVQLKSFHYDLFRKYKAFEFSRLGSFKDNQFPTIKNQFITSFEEPAPGPYTRQRVWKITLHILLSQNHLFGCVDSKMSMD